MQLDCCLATSRSQIWELSSFVDRQNLERARRSSSNHKFPYSLLTWLQKVEQKRVILVEDPLATRYDAIVSIMVVMEAQKTRLPETKTLEALVGYCFRLQPKRCDKGHRQDDGRAEYEQSGVGRTPNVQ